MSDSRRFPGVRRLITALERRLLTLLLLYGAGRLLIASAALLLALFALDRMFEPPVWFRLLLLTAAVYACGKVAWRTLLVPLRERPRPADLAALLERHHPGLQDLIATAVEVDQVHPGESAALKQAAAARAEERLSEVELRRTAPGGAARRSVIRGGLAAGLLVALAFLDPSQTRIFFDRLLGGTTPWPQATTLVLLSPYAGGEELLLDEVAPGIARLQVAQGTALTLRVRADGVVPDEVRAEGPRGRRVMQALGDGEFVLRLPALDDAETWIFRGGDDDDGTPELQLAPGYAPAIENWSVALEPPAYTGQPASESQAREFRVPQGTRLTVRFQTDLPTALAELRHLDGTREELSAGPDGAYQFLVQADRSGEYALELSGPDGFRDTRAAVLRWQAQPDAKPSVRFRFPVGRWSTVAGGRIPLVVEASDDYGLNSLSLSTDPEESRWEIPLRDGAEQIVHEERQVAPLPSAESFGSDFRMRFLAEARDGALPLEQAGRAQSPWIDVLSPASFEEQLGERMVRVRERVEDLLQRLAPLLEGENPERLAPLARRVDRELEGLTFDLEQALLERIFAGLDRGVGALEPLAAELVREGPPAAGASSAALAAPGVPPLLDRAALLLELAAAMHAVGEGPARALREATLGSADPLPAARELDTALRAVLDQLLAWEDFQSAVNLLRGLLDRQRTLYLRTQEASGR